MKAKSYNHIGIRHKGFQRGKIQIPIDGQQTPRRRGIPANLDDFANHGNVVVTGRPGFTFATCRRCEKYPATPIRQFTGKPGEITPIEETIRSFEEIADGKWDHLPEQAFMYVGVIEQAAEQAAKAEAAAKKK